MTIWLRGTLVAGIGAASARRKPHAAIRVPLFNSVTTLRVPPASLTRSLMLTSPRPLHGPSRLGDIEPLAVVGDRELRAVAGAEQPDLGLAGARVLDDVVQRFLGDPIQTERRVRADRLEVPVGRARHRHRVCTRDFGAVGGQGGRQSGMLEHVGMQVV